MPIHQRFAIKDLSDVQPGELVRLDLGGQALAIAMARNDTDETMQVLVLSSPLEGAHPCWTVVQMEDAAMSFGSEWVLDLDDSDSYPGNYDRMEEAGSIVTTPEGVVIRANGDRSSPRFRPTYFDLTRFGQNSRTPFGSTSVCTRKWKIWHSEADRTRVGAEPIFIFSEPTP